MQSIDWNSYRHPKFLQSLNITNIERKYLNLFLKRSKFENIEEVYGVAYSAAAELLAQKNILEKCYQIYLDELRDFSLTRKNNTFDTEIIEDRTYHFDFVKQFNNKFSIDPADLFSLEGITHQIFHTSYQKDLIAGYINQYGTDIIGLGRILIRANMNRLYRSVSSLGSIGTIDKLTKLSEETIA